ncbi:MAG: carbonic anhydrase [Bacteroidetes bacterium]|nr:carbonic anhydrase [Bacteroidota bacterium]
MKTLNKEERKMVDPYMALQLLRNGNFRFINNLKVNRDLLEQVNKTKNDQWPFATILSCMDSRTSAELVFDQGVGDIFSIRIAGNIVSEGILGSLEYATGVVGSCLVVVLGHTGCGAIKAACDHVELGHITSIMDKIQPATVQEQTIMDDRTGKNPEYVNAVAKLNVNNSVKEILERSSIIKKLVAEGKVGIVPAMYDVATGKITFYEEEGIINTVTADSEMAA